jgi:hypothetical protein
MSQFRFARTSLILAALGLNVAPALVGMVSHAQAAEQQAAAAGAPAAPDAAKCKAGSTRRRPCLT